MKNYRSSMILLFLAVGFSTLTYAADTGIVAATLKQHLADDLATGMAIDIKEFLARREPYSKDAPSLVHFLRNKIIGGQAAPGHMTGTGLGSLFYQGGRIEHIRSTVDSVLFNWFVLDRNGKLSDIRVNGIEYDLRRGQYVVRAPAQTKRLLQKVADHLAGEILVDLMSHTPPNELSKIVTEAELGNRHVRQIARVQQNFTTVVMRKADALRVGTSPELYKKANLKKGAALALALGAGVAALVNPTESNAAEEPQVFENSFRKPGLDEFMGQEPTAAAVGAAPAK